MSDRTTKLYGQIRTRLLTYDPVGSDPALSHTSLLNGRLYTLESPDTAAYPFAIQRLQSRRTGPGDDGRLRERGELEVQVFGRPRSALLSVERIADIMEEALYGWSTDADGLLTIRSMVSRETLPAFQSPENREIVRVRVVWSYTWWPLYRTQLATASGAPAPNP